MIKFLADKDGRPVIGLGLSRGNCARLLAGKPIFIDLKAMMKDIHPEPQINDATIFIFGGETEETMQAELLLSHGKLPEPRKHHEEN